MLRKLLIIGALLVTSQAFANATIVVFDCWQCTSDPRNKSVTQAWEIDNNGNVVRKFFSSGPCGSC